MWQGLCIVLALLVFWLMLALKAKRRETDYLQTKLTVAEEINRQYRDKELVNEIQKKHRIDRRIQVWDE